MPLRSKRESLLTSTSRFDGEVSAAAAATGVGSDPGGVGDADANPLEGESDDSEEDGAGDAVRCRYRFDLAPFGGGVAVAGRPELPLAAISVGEVRTDVEKAGLRRPFRNCRYWLGW